MSIGMKLAEAANPDAIGAAPVQIRDPGLVFVDLDNAMRTLRRYVAGYEKSSGAFHAVRGTVPRGARVPGGLYLSFPCMVGDEGQPDDCIVDTTEMDPAQAAQVLAALARHCGAQAKQALAEAESCIDELGQALASI